MTSETSKADNILAALGGAENIRVVEPCITRLRVEVEDPSVVGDEQLKENGAFGVMRTGRVVQIVVGPIADDLAAEISELL